MSECSAYAERLFGIVADSGPFCYDEALDRSLQIKKYLQKSNVIL